MPSGTNLSSFVLGMGLGQEVLSPEPFIANPQSYSREFVAAFDEEPLPERPLSEKGNAKVFGVNSDEGEQAQSLLRQLGFYDASVHLAPGDSLMAAILLWQRANDLPLTGQVDKRLLQSLNQADTTAVSVSAQATAVHPREETFFVQEALAEKGLYPEGQIDGKFGPMTQEAIQHARKRLDVPGPDEIDDALIFHLSSYRGKR